MPNPQIIKMAIKALISFIFDEEYRNRVLYIVIGLVIAIVLILSMFFYIATMPAYMIEKYFAGDDIEKVKEIQDKYGFLQNISEDDPDYIEGSDKDYSDIVFEDGQIEVVYFNQFDSRWAKEPYGNGGSTVGSSGCGPTSLAMVVSTFTPNTIYPPQMCQWSFENGYLCQGSGSYHSLIPNGAKNFGLKVEGCKTNEPQKLVDALSSGKLVIAIMGKGHFTKSGHFMVLRGVTSEGQILVADPASKPRSDKSWDLSIILDEAKKGASAGGPFWIISK